ncbi:hypothetical protein ACFTRD_16335 [Paenibacillus sp. NPDC056933]|uniref:hypothetical protein n=1 Tax=Paenibacillus sp. NPDC056933 TaxID=3345968 RepID=UPI003644690E
MKKPIQKKWWFWLIIVIIAGVITFSIDSYDSTEQKQEFVTKAVTPAENKSEKVFETEKLVTSKEETKLKKEEVKEEGIDQEKIPGSLHMTPEEFRDSFNRRAKEVGVSHIRIEKELEVRPGKDQDGFKYRLNDYVGIAGGVNRADSSVRDITMTGSPNGTTESGTDVLLTMRIIILAVNPNLPPTAITEVLTDMNVYREGIDWIKVDESTERDGIRYSVLGSEVAGILFFATDVSEKKITTN